MEFEDWLQLAVTAISFAIFGIAAFAYRRRPTGRVLLVLVAFGVYAVRGLFLVADFASEPLADIVEPVAIALDAVFLGLILAATLMR